MQVVLHTLVLFSTVRHCLPFNASSCVRAYGGQILTSEAGRGPLSPSAYQPPLRVHADFLHYLQRLVYLCGACAADNGAAGVVEEVGQTAGSTDQQRLGPGERAARLASTCGEDRGWVGCRRDGRRGRDSRGTSTMSSINDRKEGEEGSSGGS